MSGPTVVPPHPAERRPATARASWAEPPARIVATASRQRVTIDLRGLGTALRAHAQARNLTVSDVARLAVVSLLETSASSPAVEVSGDVDVATWRTVKLTIRLRSGVAAHLTNSARACGLSQGAYVTTLIDQVPAPPLAIATVLGRSTEQLAVVSADLNELMRTMRRDAASSERFIEDRLRPLLNDVRQHVGLASRLVSDLRSKRTSAPQRSGLAAGQEAHL